MKLRTIFIIVLSNLLFACGGENSGAPSQGKRTENWNVPLAQSVAVQGDVFSGKTINGNYTYFDPNSKARPENLSEFRWVIDNVTKSTSLSFDLLDEHVGKDVVFCITPIALGNVNFVGDEVCSLSVTVNTPSSNVVPEALNVAINPEVNLIAGDKISSSYVYYDQDNDAELNSKLLWFIDDILVQTGGVDFDLPADAEYKILKFCVTPISNASPTTGVQVCTQSDQVKPKVGSVPVANNVSITGALTSGTNLVGSYLYTDIDGDLEGISLFKWQLSGVDISGVSINSYTPSVTDEGETLSFCVTPVASTGEPKIGLEACYNAGIISPPLGFPPSATVSINNNSNSPVAGFRLPATYTYIPGIDGLAQGSSIVTWSVDGVDSGVTCYPFAIPCNYTIKDNDAGKVIQYCVTPVNVNGASGSKVCEDIVGTSIKYSGNFNLFENINVSLQGYSNNIKTSWGVTSSFGIQDLQSTGLTYKIEYLDKLGFTSLAYELVSQDIEFCVEDLDKSYNKYCRRVSDDSSSQYLTVSDGTFVGGGVVNRYNTPKGIAPATVYQDMTTGLKFMRPLTPEESEFVGVIADSTMGDGNVIIAHYSLANARQLCSLLPVDGGGWRLPTFDELRNFNTNLSTYNNLVVGSSPPATLSSLTYELGWRGLRAIWSGIGYSLRASDGRLYNTQPYAEGEVSIADQDTKFFAVTCVK
ncbi:hypothetical protein [Aliivibrio salmonicida]|uniref:Lipoprotein n=1 Tax=Aliivibrio salmonicida (strain LFI1238) TaxID=316275 RepID=B6ENL4_ALISL|nr:hypothetical protein [Aliivibrio salmonicida]CAQ79505.1 putative lipoprotein [Aliivibrio salmonicida LFI1238]